MTKHLIIPTEEAIAEFMNDLTAVPFQDMVNRDRLLYDLTVVLQFSDPQEVPKAAKRLREELVSNFAYADPDERSAGEHSANIISNAFFILGGKMYEIYKRLKLWDSITGYCGYRYGEMVGYDIVLKADVPGGAKSNI